MSCSHSAAAAACAILLGALAAPLAAQDAYPEGQSG